MITWWRRWRLRRAETRYAVAIERLRREEAYRPTVYPIVISELVKERIEARSEIEYLRDKLGLDRFKEAA